MKEEINSQIVEVIFKMMRGMKDSFSFASKTSHLTMLQFEALHYIKKSGEVQMSDIADCFSITMPSSTALMDKLIEMNYVSRKNDTKDRRIVRISLTEQGKKLFDEAVKQRAGKISKNLSYLSKEDKEELLRILSVVVEKLETNEK